MTICRSGRIPVMRTNRQAQVFLLVFAVVVLAGLWIVSGLVTVTTLLALAVFLLGMVAGGYLARKTF